MLKYASEIGWEYVKPDDALANRLGDTGLYFNGILVASWLCGDSNVIPNGGFFVIGQKPIEKLPEPFNNCYPDSVETKRRKCGPDADKDLQQPKWRPRV